MLGTTSVIVLVWNGEKFLAPCLESLLNQTVKPAEIIVVDNASTDRSVQIAQTYADKGAIRFLRNEDNLGYAGGNNVGIAAARGEIIVLLNQDTVVHPTWLAALQEAFTDKAVGIVGCKTLYPDEKTLQHAGGLVRFPDAFTRHVGQGEQDVGQYDEPREVDYVTGAAFAVHRRVIEQVGLLDSLFYPAFYEEIDYCYRARRAGFKVLYFPKATLIHHETPTLPAESYARVAAFHRNRVRFVLRHWEFDQLRAFTDAEAEAIESTIWLDDIVARQQAYRHNALMSLLIAREREEDATLGSPLSPQQAYWVGERLLELSEHAQSRTITLIRKPEPLHNSPELRTTSQAHPLPSLTLHEHLSDLNGLLAELDDKHVLREYYPTSPTRFVGPLLSRLRWWWLSIATRWYVLPILHHQSLINAQVLQAFQKLTQHVNDLSRTVNQLAQSVERQRIAVERLLYVLEKAPTNDPTLLQAARAWLKRAQNSDPQESEHD